MGRNHMLSGTSVVQLWSKSSEQRDRARTIKDFHFFLLFSHSSEQRNNPKHWWWEQFPAVCLCSDLLRSFFVPSTFTWDVIVVKSNNDSVTTSISTMHKESTNCTTGNIVRTFIDHCLNCHCVSAKFIFIHKQLLLFISIIRRKYLLAPFLTTVILRIPTLEHHRVVAFYFELRRFC